MIEIEALTKVYGSAERPPWLPMLGRLLTASVFGLAVAAVALASPMIGALQSLFTSLILLLNGPFLPLVLEQAYLTPLPSAALVLGRQVAAVISALPTALVVLATGAAAITLQGGQIPFDAQVLGGHSLTALPTGWGLWWPLTQPLPITAVGVVVFNRLENLARRRGTLGRH